MVTPIESTLSKTQRDSLQVDEFIFHIIDPDVDEKVAFMDEVKLEEKQKDFFIARLREILEGTQYIFKEDAVHLKDKCEEILKPDSDFNAISRQIASQFAGRHFKNMSAGVFVVATVRYLFQANLWCRLVLLVKVDKSPSFSYSHQIINGRQIATMIENPNSLPESRQAVQKSAVIDIEKRFAWEALAYDKNHKVSIEGYFKEFLGVTERLQDSVLTKTAHATVRKWARQLSKDEIPENEDAASYTGRAFNYLNDHAAFDTIDFINAVIKDEDEERKTRLQNTLLDALSISGVAGQKFAPKPGSLSPAERKTKYVTHEGVTISFDGSKDTVGFNQVLLSNGITRVTIDTRELTLKI